MTCSINHANLTTKFCSVCGAPAIQQQQQYQQPPQQYMPPQQQYQPQYQQPVYGQPPLASAGKRIGAAALDGVLYFATCGIGWLVWLLIVMAEGQTPAKQILKMRVYGTVLNRPATWGHMAVRQFLIPWTYSISAGLLAFPFIFIDMSGSSTTVMYYLLFIGGIYVYELVQLLTNPQCQRFADRWAKTVVVDESMTGY